MPVDPPLMIFGITMGQANGSLLILVLLLGLLMFEQWYWARHPDDTAEPHTIFDRWDDDADE
jgi:hypothetical protein